MCEVSYKLHTYFFMEKYFFASLIAFGRITPRPKIAARDSSDKLQHAVRYGKPQFPAAGSRVNTKDTE